MKEAIHLTSTLAPTSTPTAFHVAAPTAAVVSTTVKPANIDEYVAAPAEPLASVVGLLRDKFDLGLPETSTELWHGHPVWLDDELPVAGFKAYPTFVTVLFWRGQAITDDSGKLNASGSAEMSEFKLRSVEDFDDTLFDGWLQQVRELQAA
ncbi:MAG: DUF1801 domain-containing protein [Cryobacterium sp.]|uniref:DUF1801 domain-containing protein n=1 Tax=unclassified Cryobacterium TaxID=2649013 RepID=UPI0018CA9F5D|nr:MULTISPECIES: DUF1801 domain-containing protein [unclassified Cryobacterium]MCY7403495.1 DUF1801 domain-containing protein [Cryobacterium sp.]MEC5152703.1 hypothetical protein [Cryobacterium sp. CAN_C3]